MSSTSVSPYSQASGPAVAPPPPPPAPPSAYGSGPGLALGYSATPDTSSYGAPPPPPWAGGSYPSPPQEAPQTPSHDKKHSNTNMMLWIAGAMAGAAVLTLLGCIAFSKMRPNKVKNGNKIGNQNAAETKQNGDIAKQDKTTIPTPVAAGNVESSKAQDVTPTDGQTSFLKSSLEEAEANYQRAKETLEMSEKRVKEAQNYLRDASGAEKTRVQGRISAAKLLIKNPSQNDQGSEKALEASKTDLLKKKAALNVARYKLECQQAESLMEERKKAHNAAKKSTTTAETKVVESSPEENQNHGELLAILERRRNLEEIAKNEREEADKAYEQAKNKILPKHLGAIKNSKEAVQKKLENEYLVALSRYNGAKVLYDSANADTVAGAASMLSQHDAELKKAKESLDIATDEALLAKEEHSISESSTEWVRNAFKSITGTSYESLVDTASNAFKIARTDLQRAETTHQENQNNVRKLEQELEKVDPLLAQAALKEAIKVRDAHKEEEVRTKSEAESLRRVHEQLGKGHVVIPPAH